MPILNYIKDFYKFVKLFHNYKITIQAKNWAREIRQLAHKFTALEHDIKRGRHSDMTMIADNLQMVNGDTHYLWDRMKKELNIKE